MDTRRVRAFSLLPRSEPVGSEPSASGSTTNSMSYVEGVVNSVIEAAAANENATEMDAESIERDVKHGREVESLLDPDDGDDSQQQQPKKAKTGAEEEEKKLEQRLGGILCCAVCLDLPKSSVYQVGHLLVLLLLVVVLL